jgi:hypothetical protein
MSHCSWGGIAGVNNNTNTNNTAANTNTNVPVPIPIPMSPAPNPMPMPIPPTSTPMPLASAPTPTMSTPIPVPALMVVDTPHAHIQPHKLLLMEWIMDFFNVIFHSFFSVMLYFNIVVLIVMVVSTYKIL